MSAWWGRERTAKDLPRVTRDDVGIVPELLAADASSVRAAVRDRIGGFTPDWTNLQAGDAGVALVQLFGNETEPVLSRANGLPQALLVEYLDAGGVRSLPATPAETLLQFSVSPAAAGSVLVPQGSQAAARPASGQGDLVTFETETDVDATPDAVVEVHVQEGGVVEQVDLPPAAGSFAPLGRHPQPGSALWIGLSAKADHGQSLSLGILVAAPPGAPPPAAEGGVVALPIAPAPLLRWEAFDAGTAVAAEVLVDETGGLVRSGIVELGLPRSWRTGRPSVLGVGPDLRWLRVRIVHRTFESPPAFAGLFLNATRATAGRTIRGEVLEPVLSEPSGRQVMRVSQTPVLPGSLILEVDEGVAVDVFGVATPGSGDTGSTHRWTEVDDLSSARADDRVYVLDADSGEVTFGDGVHGARVPQGFRNVVARSYRFGGGAAGAVAAGDVKTMLTSIPFVIGVANPVAASGGTDPESMAAAVVRGPRELRARGRAVAPIDYDLLATRAPGASVARAHAVPALHPAHPGRPIPGVVGVFVVPPDRGEGPPTPDQESLRAVAHYLSTEVAPAGVEVVTAAPRYHTVSVETQVVIDPAADPGAVVRAVVAALDTYLHPLTGGDAGSGWPFGGALRYVPLVQRVLSAVPDVRAVSRLDMIVDGVRIPPCQDQAISANALVWPQSHEVEAQPDATA